ncbi:Pentatricopeptide repeat-containing protein, chloroplastic [Symbiodinium microadriaticum]|uniref:Pentatricopeptide repeat-containing protein, chloroplastic n=1 Tax=Symbiodinium microadriaticum TaxID=2951 RepID=A0A1Q9E5T9_SYMMI|nr:Pentatricopeptide repeat-containing protein, chloroplastic [Symbiodinium microadriaticum]
MLFTRQRLGTHAFRIVTNVDSCDRFDVREQTKRFAYAPEKRLLPDEVVAQELPQDASSHKAASHEHVETVAAGLHHDSVRVRQAAALALGSLGLRGATHAGALAALMKDADPGVRRAAAIALGNLGKLAADQEEVLQQASASDADDDVRFHAAVALGIVQVQPFTARRRHHRSRQLPGPGLCRLRPQLSRYDAQAELCSRLFALGEKATCKVGYRGADCIGKTRSLWAVALNKLQEYVADGTIAAAVAIVAGRQEGQWRVAVALAQSSKQDICCQLIVVKLRGLLQRMRDLDVWPDVVSFNSLMGSSQGGFIVEVEVRHPGNLGISFLVQAALTGIYLPACTGYLTDLFLANHRLGWNNYTHFMCESLRAARPTFVSHGAAASSLADGPAETYDALKFIIFWLKHRCQPWRWALQLTRDCRDNASRASVLGFGYWSIALHVLQQLPATALQPDVRFGNEVLRDCATHSWQWSLQLLHFGGEPDLIRRNSALGATRSGGQWEVALGIASLLGAARLQVDAVGQAEVAGAIANAGRWALALSFFRGLSIQGHSLDTALCSLITTACVDASEWQRALHLLDDLTALRLQADAVSCNTRLWAVAANSWQSALRELACAAAAGRVDAVSLGSAISACGQTGRWRHSLRLLEQFNSETPFNEIACNAAIGACETATREACNADKGCVIDDPCSGGAPRSPKVTHKQRSPKAWCIMVRPAVAGSLLLVLYIAYMAKPTQYTLILATFEKDSPSDPSAEEAFRESSALPSELRRKLHSPVWVADDKGEVIAMLTGGSLDDWAKNPEYVLEEVTRRKVKLRFGTFEDRCCDNGGLGDHLDRLAAAVARDVDGLFGRSWAAKLQITPKESSLIACWKTTELIRLSRQLWPKHHEKVDPSMMDLSDMHDPTLLLQGLPQTHLDAMDDGSCGPKHSKT